MSRRFEARSSTDFVLVTILATADARRSIVDTMAAIADAEWALFSAGLQGAQYNLRIEGRAQVKTNKHEPRLQ